MSSMYVLHRHCSIGNEIKICGSHITLAKDELPLSYCHIKKLQHTVNLCQVNAKVEPHYRNVLFMKSISGWI